MTSPILANVFLIFLVKSAPSRSIVQRIVHLLLNETTSLHLLNIVLLNDGFSLGNRSVLENVKINNSCCVGMYCMTTFSIRPS